MNKNQTYSSQYFLRSFFDRSGAIVENPSYGLLQTLLPEELAGSFGSDELLLAFDYEVASETPGSIFVAPGSPLLDTAVRMAADYGRYTRHYWPGKDISYPKNLEQKVSKAVDYLQCRLPRLAGHHATENVYYIFNYLCSFRTFENSDEIISVTINGFNGMPAAQFEEYWEKIIPLEEPNYQLGEAQIRPIKELYQAACREVARHVQDKARFYNDTTKQLLEKELGKTARYYQETINELQQKMKDSGDQAKRERLKAQLKASQADWQRRQEDIASRHNLEVEVRLDHLVACCVPCLLLKIDLQHKRNHYRQTLVYNPLTGEIELPPCPSCGKSTSVFTPGETGELVCPEH